MAWDYDIKQIMGSLEIIDQACGIIGDGDGCGDCPLKWACIEETPFSNIAGEVSRHDIESMLDLAADIEDFGSAQAYFQEKLRRAREEDRWMEDEWRRSQ